MKNNELESFAFRIPSEVKAKYGNLNTYEKRELLIKLTSF